MRRNKQRRSRGEGSFYVRADGRHVWEGVIAGRRIYVYGATKEDVSRKKNELLGDIANGLPLIVAKGSVAEFLVEWLASVRRSRAPKTYASYESAVRVHIAPSIGSIALAKLTQTDVRVKLIEPLAKTPRMQAYVLVVLRRALNVAMKWDRVRRNVATFVEMPTHQTKPIKPYNDDEWSKYLRALEGHRYRALFLAGGVLGLRKGEAGGLSWGNVEFAKDRNGSDIVKLKIVQQVQRVAFDAEGHRVKGGAALQILRVKTKKSNRIVIGGPELAAAFRDARTVQLKMRLKAGETWNNEHDLVFTSRTGQPLDPRNILRMHYAVVRKAGTREGVTFHGLRHQAGSDMVASGIDLGKVRDILGHSSIRVTSDIYVEPRMTDEDIATIDRNAKPRATGGAGAQRRLSHPAHK